VDSAGGDFKVQVLQSMPGTRAAWRELVVSEFRVVGRPGPTKRATDDPLRVALGSLDVEPPTVSRIENSRVDPTYWSVQAACSAYRSDLAANLAAATAEQLSDEEKGQKRGPSQCTEIPVSFAFSPIAPYKSVHAVRMSDGIGRHDELVLETNRGFFLTGVRWAERDPRSPGCPSMVNNLYVDALRIENGYFVAVVAGGRVAYVNVPDVPPDFDDGARLELVRGAYWGKDDGKSLQVNYWSAQYNSAFGSKLQSHNNRRRNAVLEQVPVPTQPWEEIAWTHVVPFRITQSGLLQPQK
jgi:hypothetical protein